MDMAEVVRRLESHYGPPPPRRPTAPVDELVLTILSQNTSDLNSGRAYASLRRRFPTWDAVVEAPVEEVEEAIRGGGLARQKAPRIQAALRSLAAQPGGLGMRWLYGLQPTEALRRLVALPGVGPKTASCVLLFSLGVPVMPVDTHVHRVALRLGLLGAGTSAERAHELLTAATPPERMLEAHLLLIEHGRRICRPRPGCAGCPLLDGCPYGRARVYPDAECDA